MVYAERQSLICRASGATFAGVGVFYMVFSCLSENLDENQ
jgi:hypothetical protein